MILFREEGRIVNGELMQNGTDIGAYKAYICRKDSKKICGCRESEIYCDGADIRDYYDQNLTFQVAE